MEPQKLKRVVIKEELVALTGNYVDAILLNQLLYWSERVKDFDLFMQQEAETESREPENQLFGWIYKSFKELSDETMLGLVPNSIKTHLNNLCEKGFIFVRENRNNWDRRKEYKINLKYIQKELILLGYSLDGYSMGLPFAFSANGCAENANGFANSANRTVKNCKTVTEITTEITTEKNNMSPAGAADVKFDKNSDEIKIVDFFINKLKELNPKIRVPDTLAKKQKWAADIDKLLRIDKRDKHEVCEVISYVVADDFWKSNVLSPDKLRKQYDRLVLKMQQQNSKKAVVKSDDADDTEALLKKRREERMKMNEQ